MRKLKRVISLNFPLSRLPVDLQDGRPRSTRVDVTVEEEGPEGSEYETTVQDFSHLPSADEDEASLSIGTAQEPST